MMRLDGGKCALREVRVRRRGAAEYLSADLAFSNGETYEVPLYLPVDAADVMSRATELARQLGELAAESGQLDFADWVRSDRIPLREYIVGSIEKNVIKLQRPSEIQFRTRVEHERPGHLIRHPGKRPSFRFVVELFDGASDLRGHGFSLGIPDSEQDRDFLERFCRDSVATVLSGDQRRSMTRSTAKVRKGTTEYVIETPPSSSSTNTRLGGEWVAHFGWKESRQSVSISLGTMSEEVAKSRLKAIGEWISRELSESRRITIGDLRTEGLRIAGERISLRGKSRNLMALGEKIGLIEIRNPSDESFPDHDMLMLKCYVGSVGSPGQPCGIVVRLASPEGSANRSLFKTTIMLSKDGTLDEERLLSLKDQLKEFLLLKLQSFYAAGGVFPIASDWSDGILNDKGRERLSRILEFRLEPIFLQGAVSQGIANPFQSELSWETISQFTKKLVMCAPAHPLITLEAPRFGVDFGGGERVVTAILNFRGTDGALHFQGIIRVPNMAALRDLVGRIDQWTSHCLRTSGSVLPPFQTIEFLRQQSHLLDIDQNRSPRPSR